MSHTGPLDQDRAQELVEARELRASLRVVGDLVRLQILRRLAENEEMGVTELAYALRVSQPLLSWHLGVLKRAGLVKVRREGRLVWYALDHQALRSFRQRLDEWLGEQTEEQERKNDA
jgi:DNA-binding transcriptional ArsR family regulator